MNRCFYFAENKPEVLNNFVLAWAYPAADWDGRESVGIVWENVIAEEKAWKKGRKGKASMSCLAWEECRENPSTKGEKIEGLMRTDGLTEIDSGRELAPTQVLLGWLGENHRWGEGLKNRNGSKKLYFFPSKRSFFSRRQIHSETVAKLVVKRPTFLWN